MFQTVVLLMIGLICNVLFIYIWSSCSPASRNSYICKVPTAGINRRSDYFANSPAINTYNTIDNGINSATPSDDEKELAVTADIEEKILNLAEKSELEALTDNSNEDLLQRMHLSGVVRLDDLIPEEVVLKLVDFIRSELKESIIDVKNGKVQPLQRFSNMLSSANRWDLKIPLENPIVMETMKTMFRRDGPLGQLMTSLVSENGELFELAAFCTSSGASRQVMHADTLWSKQPALYTCAVALQDVTEDMGPTLFIPGNLMLTND